VSDGLWVGAVTTLAGATLGGAISFLLSRQQIIEARAQRKEEATREKNRRSLERRFDAYADFLKRARSYRNAIRPYAMTGTDTHEIDALAQAADAAGAFISLVAENEMTLSASHKVLAAIANSQELLHNPDSHSRNARWPEANDEMVLSLRQFQAAAREKLEVNGVDRSWVLSHGRPEGQADGM
jgi:hypothetical protein